MKALLFFLIFAIVVFAIVCIVFFFKPGHNPFLLKSKIKELEVGEVRWFKDSPKKGHGHAVALVRKIDNEYIYYDRYELRQSKPYTLVQVNTRARVKAFFDMTSGFPCYKEYIFG